MLPPGSPACGVGSSRRADWRRAPDRVTSRLVVRRLSFLFVVAALVLAPAQVALADGDTLILATEAEEDSEMVEQAPSGAAVDADPGEEEAVEQPWTQRFLVPTLLLLGVVGVGSSFLVYIFRLRSRYTVTP